MGKLKRPNHNGFGLLYYPHKISRSGFLVMPLMMVVMMPPVHMVHTVYAMQLNGLSLGRSTQQRQQRDGGKQ